MVRTEAEKPGSSGDKAEACQSDFARMSDGRDGISVAVAGLGSIGFEVVEAIESGRVPGFAVAAVSARATEAAREKLRGLGTEIPVVPIEQLEPHADLVVECAPGPLLPQIVLPFLEAGKRAVVLSVGALLTQERVVAAADDNGGQIIVPSGALGGLDAVTAAMEGEIRSVRMITRKPVRGLVGAPYLAEHGIDLEPATEAVKVFDGSAREAAAGFPRNLNVAAALALAGTGPDRTAIEIWADPGLRVNTHEIAVESDSAAFSMKIENIPTENPRTGRITALSVLATLRKMTAALRVGT